MATVLSIEGQKLTPSTIAAAGGSQGAATLVTLTNTIASDVDGVKGVRLPPATVGAVYYLSNPSTTLPLVVYPATGEGIYSGDGAGAGTANLPVNVQRKGLGVFVCSATGSWHANVGVTYAGSNSDWTLGNGILGCGSLNIVVRSLAAAGSAQSDAALVVAGTVVVSGASGTNGVKLPTVVTGLIIPIYNGDASNVLLVYPTAGGSVTINGGTANVAISVPAKTLIWCVVTSATNWAVMIVNTVAAADTIAEVTPAAGVTVDGVILKDTTVDVNGTANAIILDADGDTHISSPTDNQIDISIAGADDFTITANTLTALTGSTIKTNTLAETTSGAGVMCSSAFQAHGNAAVTATVGGGTTGLIPVGSSFATVTSDDANKQISLPAGTVGDVIRIYVGTNGCELIAVTAGDKVNNVIVGATNEAALVATTTYTCRYVGTNTWLMSGQTFLGAVETAVIPDVL